jgi:hypothetical protein
VIDTTADWIDAVQALFDHGASTEEMTLEPDQPKPPSPALADLLRARIDHPPPR